MEKKPRVLIADDVEANRRVLTHFLVDMGYTILEAENGKIALERIMKEKPDIIILDIMMPEMDGIEVCRISKSNPETKMIPIIIITALSDESNHLNALKSGADDFLTKPFNIHFLKARLKSLLALKLMNDMNMEYQKRLKKSNIDLLNQVVSTQDVTILALAKLAEFRDPETGEHLERMREYARVIALTLKNLPAYSSYIDDRYIENIYKSTPLHDIGKVGIPDGILLKPGKLTNEEFDIMKKHSIIGGDALSEAIKLSGMEQSFLDMGKEIAYSHHERWSGAGYPEGLKESNIPLSARITALADVYDALTSKRVYKDAFPHEKARAIILEEKGGQFDPDIVDAFEKNEKEFIDIKKEYRDTGSKMICYVS